MALFKFAEAIDSGRPIAVYNGGRVRRDFTYVGDVVAGVMRVLTCPPRVGETRSSDAGRTPQTTAPLRVYNLGSHRPEPVARVLDLLEHHLGRQAHRRDVPLPNCELPETFADIVPLAADFDFRPATPLEVGVQRFVEWWREERT
jgi:UDP-glucuronate 4-epimerase